MSSAQSSSHTITLEVGHNELIIRQRYEVASIANDILIGVWFVAGSILFFWESTSMIGTWFFLAGSVEMLIRPIIRLGRRVSLSRIGSGQPRESARDF